MAKITIDKEIDETLNQGRFEDDPDMNESDMSAGLSFDDLDHEGKLRVRKEIRRFKKGF